MSVYRDSDQSPVTFKHPIGTALTATVVDSTGTTVATQSGISPSSGVYTYYVPWSLTQYDATYTLNWTDGGTFSRKQTFDVVTPIVDLATLQTVFTDELQTPQTGDVEDMEQLVRAVVTTYTGQKFGYSVGSRNYVGNGSGRLILKEHCDNLLGVLGVYGGYPSDYVSPTNQTNLNGELNLDTIGLIEDGWVALINFPTYLDVKQSPPVELLDSVPSQDGTIRVPRRLTRLYDSGTQYTLYGEWGYPEVPGEVVEAALLLANDYITGDSGYRDRYLEILKIQQDSFTYHPGAFRGTGNARADLLLGQYRRQGGMIVL